MSAQHDAPGVNRGPATPVSAKSPRATSVLRDFLAHVARRLAWIAAAEGAAAGLALAAVIAIVSGWGRGWVTQAVIVGLALAALGIAARLLASARERRGVAGLVERRAPRCRNIVVTAAELIDRPTTIRPDIGTLVFREADRVVAGLDPAALFPARRAITALVLGALLWVVALVLVAPQPAMSTTVVDVPIESVAIHGVDVVVTPPAYAGRPAQSLRDPSRIEALAGSRIGVTVRATAASATLETIAGGRQTLIVDEASSRSSARAFTGDVVADADGFIAIGVVASDGRPGVSRLIGISVTPDRPPRVRITAPARDLFLPEARNAIAVAIEADDDLALASLRLRHTTVSGSGERFTFIDGETPLTIARTTARTWTARGSLPLGSMELGPGDVVVYRAVATDRRPGAASTESDAFIVEITAPGAVAAEGFAADDEIDRNAVSQQMVILKTQRLLARRDSITAETLAEEARGIAAEQRRVRAEFVFMMGGELAEDVTGVTGISELNEEEEAEAGDDILAGRLANRGRVALVQAIRSMSQADAKLIAVDVDGALKDELLALEHLQNAFSRTRYILRALTLRERLDLTRRLTGVLSDASRDLRPISEATTDPSISSLREALSGIAALAGATEAGARDDSASSRASMLAQRVLRVGPSSEPLQSVAARLTEAGDAIGRAQHAEARDLLQRAAIELAAIVRAALIEAPSRSPSLDVRRLEGALGDALRTPGVPR